MKFGGGVIKLDEKIEIGKESNNSNGSFGALYVSEARAVVATYLLSYVVPSFDREKIENVIVSGEDKDDYNYREKLYFTSSIDAATKVAFEKAGKKVTKYSSDFIVIYIDKNSKTQLKVGDKIQRINNKTVSNYDEILEEIESSEKVNITVKRDEKIIDTVNYKMNLKGESKLGIVISNEVKYKSNPEVNFKFKGRESGPSGGLMIALTIYDKLLKEDITKGYKVVGTGTINTEGLVGEIGGIKYKIRAADSKKADIVFVPKDNYKEAKREYDKNNYKFKLIPVRTFDDAVNYLKNL